MLFYLTLFIAFVAVGFYLHSTFKKKQKAYVALPDTARMYHSIPDGFPYYIPIWTFTVFLVVTAIASYGSALSTEQDFIVMNNKLTALRSQERDISQQLEAYSLKYLEHEKASIKNMFPEKLATLLLVQPQLQGNQIITGLMARSQSLRSAITDLQLQKENVRADLQYRARAFFVWYSPSVNLNE